MNAEIELEAVIICGWECRWRMDWLFDGKEKDLWQCFLICAPLKVTINGNSNENEQRSEWLILLIIQRWYAHLCLCEATHLLSCLIGHALHVIFLMIAPLRAGRAIHPAIETVQNEIAFLYEVWWSSAVLEVQLCSLFRFHAESRHSHALAFFVSLHFLPIIEHMGWMYAWCKQIIINDSCNSLGLFPCSSNKRGLIGNALPSIVTVLNWAISCFWESEASTLNASNCFWPPIILWNSTNHFFTGNRSSNIGPLFLWASLLGKSYERYTFSHNFCRKCEWGRVEMCKGCKFFLTLRIIIWFWIRLQISTMSIFRKSTKKLSLFNTINSFFAYNNRKTAHRKSSSKLCTKHVNAFMPTTPNSLAISWLVSNAVVFWTLIDAIFAVTLFFINVQFLPHSAMPHSSTNSKAAFMALSTVVWASFDGIWLVL